jgi:hypothetical protein
MYKGNQGLVKMQIPVLNKSRGMRRRIELQGPIDWYVCIYMCVYVYVMNICMSIYSHMYECVIIFKCMYVYMSTHIRIYECVCKSKGVRRRIELQGPIDWYVYICMCIYIYIYVCVYVFM